MNSVKKFVEFKLERELYRTEKIVLDFDNNFIELVVWSEELQTYITIKGTNWNFEDYYTWKKEN